MKKLATSILAGCLVLGLTACTPNGDNMRTRNVPNNNLGTQNVNDNRGGVIDNNRWNGVPAPGAPGDGINQFNNNGIYRTTPDLTNNGLNRTTTNGWNGTNAGPLNDGNGMNLAPGTGT